MSRLIVAHIRELQPYIPGEQPRIAGLIKLNTNENPYPPSPKVIRAVKKAVGGSLRLYPDPVALSLRKTLAGRFRCSTDNVFVGNGSDEILALCLRAFAGDRAAVQFPMPSYSLYPVLVQIENARAKSIPFRPGFELSAKDFDRASPLTFVANPNAPSGTWIPKRILAQLAERLRGVLVIDEAYVDFADDDCASLAARFPNVLVTRSFSKSYSLAGMRVGFCLGHRALIEALFKVKDSYNVDRLAQIAAEAAFKDQAYLSRTVARIRRTRERLGRELGRRGWEVLPSAANFVFAMPPKRTSAQQVFGELRRRKILVRHFPGKRTGAFLRISIGTDKEIDFLLKALQSLGF